MCTRIELLGVGIDPLSLDQAAGQIHAWIAAAEAKCRYVVTTNVDRVVLLERHAGLKAAYAQAGLILADGAPVIWASHLLGKPLPRRVAACDLVSALFDAAPDENPITVFLLGAAPGVAERAAANVHRRWPGVRIVGTYSPPKGFEKDRAESLRILARIADARPNLLIVGLGATRQELWVHQHLAQIEARVALCAGSTIDVLAGEGAPVWLRDLGLAWLHGILNEPLRLTARYARGFWIFPQIVVREWWQRAHEPVRARS